jgi:hypothetical protein
MPNTRAIRTAASYSLATDEAAIVLANFTEEGIRKIKDSPKRADAFKDMAKKVGATVKELFCGDEEHSRQGVVECQLGVSPLRRRQVLLFAFSMCRRIMHNRTRYPL